MRIETDKLLMTGGPLYFLLRGMDKAGSGRVDISIAEVAASLGKSTRTIRRYLKSRFLFRSVVGRGDKVRVYLATLKGGRGVAFEGDLDCLREPKKYATWAVALSLQNSAIRAVSRKDKRQRKDPREKLGPKNPLDYFSNDGISSQDAKGQIHRSVKNGIHRFFMNSDTNHAGGSQRTMAAFLKRSTRQVSRDLSSVLKARVYVFKPCYRDEKLKAAQLDRENGTNYRGRYYTFKNMTFKAMTNVYYKGLAILGGARVNASTAYLDAEDDEYYYSYESPSYDDPFLLDKEW